MSELTKAVLKAKKEWECTFDAMSDWISLVDLKHRILRTNRAGEELLGIDCKELVGQNCCKLVHGSEKPFSECPMRKMIKTMTRESVELCHPVMNCWLLITVDPMMDQNGNLSGAVHIVRDITERKKMELELRKRTFDLDERIKELNCLLQISNLVNLRGLSLDKILQEIVNLIPPAFQYPDITCARIICGEGEYRTVNFRETVRKWSTNITFRNRKLGVVEVDYLKNVPKCGDGFFLEEEKELINAIAVRVAEIIERKRAEEMLRESEERFRTSFEYAPVGKCLTTPNGRLFMVNRSLCNLLGYTEEELLTKDFVAITHPDDVEISRECVRQLLEDEREVYRFEKRYLHKSGKIVWAFVSAFLMRDDESRPLYFIAHIQDISEQKRIEETLKESEKRFRSLFENAVLGLYRTTPDGHILMANPALVRMLDYASFEELSLCNLEENGFALEYPRSLFKQTIESEGQVTGLESRWMRKDGSIIYVRESARCVTDEKDDTKYYEGTVEDITERRQAEKALRESEEQFHSLVETMSDGVMQVNNDDVIMFVNTGLCSIFGYTKDELIGKVGHNILFDEEDREFIRQKNRVRTEGVSDRYEIKARKKSGEKIWVQISGAPMYNATGAVTGSVGILSDITERKRAEEALRESEAQLENALKIAHLGPWEYDVANDIFTFTDSFYAIFRTTAEQVDGYTMSSAEYAKRFVHPEDIHIVGEEVRKAIETQDPNFNRLLEHRILYADGEVGHITVRFFIVKDEKGKTVRTYGVNQDITERKRAEEALRESEERYRNLFETSPISLWEEDFSEVKEYFDRLDIDAGEFESYLDRHQEVISRGVELIKIIGVNHASLALHRAKDKNHLLQNLKDTFTDESYHVFKKQMVALRRGKNIYNIETTVRTLNGEKRDVLVNWVVPAGHEKTLSRVVVSLSDITERNQLQRQLLQSEKMSALGQLISGVTHELNNPLTGVIGFSQLLLTSPDIPEAHKHTIEKINMEAERSRKIVQNLLTFARQHKPTRRRVAINEIVGRTLELRAYEMRVNNIEVLTEFDSSIPSVFADEHQLQQVFINIIINAEQAMLGAHGKGRLKVVTSFDKKSDKVRIVFEDDGPGIPEGLQSKIFNPFFTTKPEGKGTGLGLSISYGIIEEHGGRIMAGNGQGKGATFTIELPITPE